MHDGRLPRAIAAAEAARGAAPANPNVAALLADLYVRNNEARRARMMEHFGQTEATLQRLRGPIGVYIGSKTPPEIAVSVMAEILAVKNGVALPQGVEVARAKNERELAPTGPLVCGV